MHPLTNLRDISFGQLFCFPEVHRQLDYYKIAAPNNFKGTQSISLCLCSYFTFGAYFVQLNVDLSVDLVHHDVAFHVKKRWTEVSLSSDVVAIVTDNSTAIGSVQRVDIEESIALALGLKIF